MSLFSEFITCDKNTISSLHKLADMITTFLKTYDGIINSYVLDYFVEYSWSKLPLSWQNHLSNWEAKDISQFLDPEYQCTEMWPLSLLAFRAAAFSLSLHRHPICSSKSVASFLQSVSKAREMDFVNFSWAEEPNKTNDLGCMGRKNVSLKKQHEIVRLAELTNLVLQKQDIRHVIDIGSGRGHLARLLCFQYKFKVATLEAVPKYILFAKKFDKQTKTKLDLKNKKNMVICDEDGCNGSSVQENMPHHFEGVMVLNSCKEKLTELLHEAWFKTEEGDTSKVPVALLGLHTCGDLGVALLKSFIGTLQAKVLFSVSCCYMKLNGKTGSSSEADVHSGNNQGYPLSKFVGGLSYSDLSYVARELSCHAIEGYIQRLKDDEASLKIHCYRAVLEKIIVNHHPESGHLGLRTVKNYGNKNFFEYATEALSKCALDIPISSLESPGNDVLLLEWKKVIVLYSIRTLIAPVIESLILVDRMIYLYENGCSSCLFPLFDPLLSPRNQVLLAVKP